MLESRSLTRPDTAEASDVAGLFEGADAVCYLPNQRWVTIRPGVAMMAEIAARLKLMFRIIR